MHDPRPNLSRQQVPEALLASRVTIAMPEVASVFALLSNNPHALEFMGSSNVYPDCGSLTFSGLQGGVRLNGSRFEISNRLISPFAQQDIGDLCNELNSRLFNSLGESYGAKVGTDQHGWPAILVSRRIEIEGFTFDEKVAQFAFTPGRVLAFDFCPEQTDVRIAAHVADEGMVALRLLKDFIDATYRLRNELPPKTCISISARA